MRTLFERLGHLAVWAGLYAGAAVVCFAQVAGLPITQFRLWLALASAVLCALAVYLLDRVKVRDAWLDPADAAAQPGRMAYLTRHAGGVRALILVLLAGATVAAAFLTSWAALLPSLACAGVIFYAGRPRAGRPRPKDVLLIKNGLVAAGITGLAFLIGIAAAHQSVGSQVADRTTLVPLAVIASTAHLFLRVLADAALCDIDDEATDRVYGTRTLSTDLGRRRAWNIAMAARLALAVGLVGLPIGPPRARLAWGLVTVVSTLALRVANPARIRDWVDIRFPLEAMGVWLLMR